MDHPPTYDEVLQSSKVRTPLLILVIFLPRCMRTVLFSGDQYTGEVCMYGCCAPSYTRSCGRGRVLRKGRGRSMRC